MTTAKQPHHSGSGFFARILAALLIVNIATIGILIFVTYSQNESSVIKRTRENIHQQVSILAEKFAEEYRNALERSLRTLIAAPTLNDYLLGSEAEKLVLARKLEREYLSYLRDYPFIRSINYIDDDYRVAISAKNGIRQSGLIDLSMLSDSKGQLEWQQILRLYENLKNTPLLLSSGNMEWFMPPREAQISGPYANNEGETAAAIGLSKLDTNTGTFGGVVIIEFDLEPWFDELRNLQFFDETPVWVFDRDGRVLMSPENARIRLNPQIYMHSDVSSDIQMIETEKGLVAYIDLPLGPDDRFVRLVASIPTALLLLDLNPVTEFFTLVLAGSILLLILISYVVSRYLALPVKALQIAQSRLANAQRIARLGHWEWQIDSPKVALSEHARTILGIDKDCGDITFRQFVDCAFEDDRPALSRLIQEVIGTHRNGSIEHRVIYEDGSDAYVCQDIEIDAGQKNWIVGTIQDTTQRQKAEQRIKKLAYYDPITGLANRTLLIQLASDAIEQAQTTGYVIGFVFLDLDHFKRINDTFGHEAGDELLRQVAERLRQCVRLTDTLGIPSEFEHAEKTVSRLGGDEFVILLTRLSQPDDARIVAERVKDYLTRKFTINGKEVFISGSLGISLYPENGSSVDDLLRHADAAMYHAKNNGRNRYEFFTSSIESDIAHRLNTETSLHQALENKDFILHYQPRVDLETNRIVAVEALIRWVDRDRGMIPPDQFIPVAEETGLIVPIGEWVLYESCRQLKRWQETVGAVVTMSINLSPVQFRATNLLDSIKHAMKESAIDPGRIELELTENALFDDLEASVQLANEFKTLGVKLSIDDFGTGYSSLQQLKRFPVDIIKIDRSFIRDVLADSDDALIVKTAISLGHNLRLRVVAEGVETDQQLDFLRQHHCDEAQGYLLGRPQSASDVEQLMLKESGDAQQIATNTKIPRSA